MAATDKAVRLVAYLEAAKGLLVLAAATGLLSLIHRDVYELAALLVKHSHLNPAAKYPQIFLVAAANIGDARLLLLALGAALYSTVRLVEAYGLYYQRTWAEVLAAVSGAIYIPFELADLVYKPGWLGAVVLLVNLAVVALMVVALLHRRRVRADAKAQS